MAGPRGGFADLLHEQRTRAGLTQQEVAEATGLSLRTVSNLERGVEGTPQRETVRLLSDALGLGGADRERFETTARGRPLKLASPAAAAVQSLPRDVPAFTGRQLDLERLAESALAAGGVAAGGVVSIHAIGGMAG
ncbi:MAG TPA: helix-turn-helix transcriptional regulator, partial [Trebonia sp.]